MLVRPHPEGWRITLHPAHGLLAADIYSHLPSVAPPGLSLPTLLAVAQHDDHQVDFSSGDYLTDRGAPKDFTLLRMDEAQRSEQAEALLEDAYRKHLWTGLLIGRHYEHLYKGESVDARLKKLLKGIVVKRKQVLQQRGWPAELLETVYGRMRFCDRLSLILCGEELPAQGRRLEVNDGLGEPTFVCQDPETEELKLAPWCLAEAEATVSVESYVLDQLTYTSGSALGAALAKGLPEVREWKFKK
ncbi:hypothetical protein GGR26_000715 [Lewinella marina]|uniref:DUF3891 domain-containing protein n=1 Tax=Neolewinella marina TaxID=438751 RepID=A0A2G0CIT6_9BACT|nr:DUF3891 family protein [Neolewinella marina]NJB84970.1 hypothetical protein [Neolewinella marina]PHK99879.1 hypothetical protein CGL56_02205 [Neolewinella marina]